MGDTSELGPIDPQVIRTDCNGNRLRHSVKNYLDAYEKHRKVLEDKPNDVAARMMLSKLDPETVELFQSVMERARQFAEKQLSQGMMQNNQGNWSRAVSELLSSPTHGQPISWEDAGHSKYGLTVDHFLPSDLLWQKLWSLYCLQMLAVGDQQKLFESEIASICINSRAV